MKKNEAIEIVVANGISSAYAEQMKYNELMQIVARIRHAEQSEAEAEQSEAEAEQTSEAESITEVLESVIEEADAESMKALEEILEEAEQSEAEAEQKVYDKVQYCRALEEISKGKETFKIIAECEREHRTNYCEADYAYIKCFFSATKYLQVYLKRDEVRYVIHKKEWESVKDFLSRTNCEVRKYKYNATTQDFRYYEVRCKYEESVYITRKLIGMIKNYYITSAIRKAK